MVLGRVSLQLIHLFSLSTHMSSAPPPGNPPTNPEKKPDGPASDAPPSTEGTPTAMDVTPDAPPPEETWDDIPEDIRALSTDEILTRTRLIDNDIKASLFTLLWSIQAHHCIIGYEVRNTTVTTRTKCYEGEDSGQWREDQAEQSTAVSCWERRRGTSDSSRICGLQ